MIGGLLLAIGIALALGLRSNASVLWPWLDIALITALIIAGMLFLKRISNSNDNTHYIDNTYYSDSSGWHDGSRHSHRANRSEDARQEDRHDDGWGGEGGGDGGGGGD